MAAAGGAPPAGARGNGGTVGSLAQQYGEMAIESLVKYLAARPPFNHLIARVGPMQAKAILVGLPGFGATAAQMAIRPEVFGPAAEILRDLTSETFKQVARAIAAGGGVALSQDQIDVIVEDAVEEVLDWEVVMAFGHYHWPSCSILMQIPPRSKKTMSFVDAVEGGAVACGVCQARLAAKLEATKAPKVKQPPKGGSALDMADVLETAEQRKKFLQIIAGLSQVQLKKVSMHLDTVGEARMLVEAYDAGIPLDQIVDLLEAQSSRTRAKEEFQELAGPVNELLKGAWDALSSKAGSAGSAIGGAAKTAGGGIATGAKAAGGGIATAATFTWGKAVKANGRLEQDLQPRVVAAQAWAQRQQQQAQQPLPAKQGFWSMVLDAVCPWRW